MAANGMLVCSFYVKKRFSRSTDSLLALNQMIDFETPDGETVEFDNIFHLIHVFCHRYEGFSDDEKRQKVFSINRRSLIFDDFPTYSYCSFVVRSGGYGVEGDITDRITQRVTYRRSENEADVKEFRVVVYVPKDTGDVTVKKGILVFQSIASFGVKTITAAYLRAFFAEGGLTFETRSVSVRAFIEKLIEQGRLHKITLINNYVSPNPADNMLISTGREEKSYIQPTLKQEWLQRILSLFQAADETGVCEIPEGEEFDDISIQFKLGKRLRTVRLKYLDKLSIVEDIPDEVFAYREPSALIEYMVHTADAYKERMVFTSLIGA